MTYFDLYQAFLKRYNFHDDVNKNNDFYNLLFHYSKQVKNVADFFMYKNNEIDFLEQIEKFKSDLSLMSKYHFPVSYLTKKHFFYGRYFYLHKGTLVPRSETELLVDQIVLENYRSNLKILDLCSGIGVIGLSLCVNLKAQVTLVEQDEIAYYLALKNRSLLHLKNRAHLVHSSMQRFLRFNTKKFDVIVMNPPYIDPLRQPDLSVWRYEPKKALFAKEHGLYFYKKLFYHLPKLMKNKILVYCEIDDNQADAIQKLLANVWWRDSLDYEIVFKTDYHNLTRYLKLEIRRKNEVYQN